VKVVEKAPKTPRTPKKQPKQKKQKIAKVVVDVDAEAVVEKVQASKEANRELSALRKELIEVKSQLEVIVLYLFLLLLMFH